MRKKSTKNKYQKQEVVEGRIKGNAKGFGFLITDDSEYYVPRDYMSGAIHGDFVRANKVPNTDNAHIIKIIERKYHTITGVYHKAIIGGYIEPDDRHFGQIFIKSANGAQDNQRIAASIDEFNKWQIIEVLDSDSLIDELKAVVYQYGLSTKFSSKVIKNAKDVCRIDKSDYINRLDLRQELIFTIDGEDSRDFDDAVSIEKTKDGYRLGVHIADVAHYVRQDSALDKEAFYRGTSVYFPTAVIPMLPESLSNGICSLDENQDRLTLSVIMDIDNNGSVTKHKIAQSVIKSKARMTYKNTAKILEGDKELCQKYSYLVNPLKDMAQLASILKQKRVERGALNFETYEPLFEINGNQVLDLKRREQLVTHSLIEEFMVLTNETVAEYFHKSGTPFVYRVHACPPPDKAERLRIFLSTVGVVFEGGLKSMDIQALLDSVDADKAAVVNKAVLRAMAKAVYSPKCQGHYGLASTYYCHFTSPIRRYPDLMIHRIIKSALNKEPLKKYNGIVEQASVQSTQKEILAEEAERKFNDILTARYMQNHIGSEFEGIISGVTEWGVFVELENTAEGLIRTESLEGEYEYDEDSMILKGEKTFMLGQRIRIVVADVRADKIEFQLKK